MIKKLAKNLIYKKYSKKNIFRLNFFKSSQARIQVLLRAFSHKTLCFLAINLKKPAYMAIFIRQK